MSYENGHIFKPVDTSDVSTVLGEPSNDVGTLCMSSKINPDSLIGPRATMNPALGPEDFKSTTSGLANTPPNFENFTAQLCPWNVYVPTGTPSGTAFRSNPVPAWTVNRPGADHFKCLTHFDGYRHDAAVIAPIIDTQVVVGMPVKITLRAQGADVNIVNATKNMGGTVSIANVLGAMYFGASLYINDEYKESVVNSTKIDITGKPTTVTVEFQSSYKPAENDNVRIVPWVTQSSSLGTDSRYFTIRVSEKVQGFYYIQGLQSENIVGVRPTAFLYEDASENFPNGDIVDSSHTYAKGNAIRMTLKGVNTYSGSPLALKLTKVKFSYWDRTAQTVVDKEVAPNIYPSGTNPLIDASSDGYSNYYVFIKASPGANELPESMGDIRDVTIYVQVSQYESGTLVTKTREFQQSSTDHNVEIKQITWTEDEPPA